MKQSIIKLLETIIYKLSDEDIYHRLGKRKVDIGTATKMWHRFLDLEKEVEILKEKLMKLEDMKLLNSKVKISGPGSLTCDLVGNHTVCPADCHGTGGCSPTPRKYLNKTWEEFYKDAGLKIWNKE